MNVLFAGEGGQGVQVIAEILAKAAFYEGKQASYIPNFGVEQRGGVSLAFVVIDQKPIFYPKFKEADILAILSDRSVPRVKLYCGKKTKIIFGPATKNGHKPNLPTRTWNLVVLGQVNKIGKIVSESFLLKAIDERFAKHFQKDPLLREEDIKALNYQKGDLQ